jgi:hypothetical protein
LAGRARDVPAQDAPAHRFEPWAARAWAAVPCTPGGDLSGEQSCAEAELAARPVSRGRLRLEPGASPVTQREARTLAPRLPLEHWELRASLDERELRARQVQQESTQPAVPRALWGARPAESQAEPEDEQSEPVDALFAA